MALFNLKYPDLYNAWVKHLQETKPYLQDHDIKVHAFRNAEDNIQVPVKD